MSGGGGGLEQPQRRRERTMLQNFTSAVRELQRTFGDAFNTYRPELYYMRGPGPACLAKATPKASSGNGARHKRISGYRKPAKARA